MRRCGPRHEPRALQAGRSAGARSGRSLGALARALGRRGTDRVTGRVPVRVVPAASWATPTGTRAVLHPTPRPTTDNRQPIRVPRRSDGGASRRLCPANALRLDRFGDHALPVDRRPGLRCDPLAPARRAREEEVLAEPFARRGPGASRLARRDEELPRPVHPSDCCTTAGVARSAERLGSRIRPADRTFLHSGR